MFVRVYSAQWEFCPRCGCHAILRFEKGRESLAIGSKEAGRMLIEASCALGKIRRHEVSRLCKAIENSNLKPAITEVDIIRMQAEMENPVHLFDGCALYGNLRSAEN